MATKKKDSCAVKLGRKGGKATAAKRKAKGTRSNALIAKPKPKAKAKAKRRARPATQAALF